MSKRKQSNSISLHPEHVEMLDELKELIEKDIYDSLPQYRKYYPEITYRQIVGSLIQEELAKMRKAKGIVYTV